MDWQSARWSSALVALSVALCLPAAVNAEEGLYRGFPIHPPEAVAGLVAGLSRLEIPFGRVEAWQFEPGRSSSEARAPRCQTVAVPGELSVFEAVAARASAAGWMELERSGPGGPAPKRVYGRARADALEVVTVIFSRSPAELGSDGEPFPYREGVIYEFETAAAPALHEGFPLSFAPVGTAEKLHPVPDGTALEYLPQGYAALHAFQGGNLVLALPLLYGWERVQRPGRKAFFSRGERLVAVDWGEAGMAVTWFSPEAGPQGPWRPRRRPAVGRSIALQPLPGRLPPVALRGFIHSMADDAAPKPPTVLAAKSPDAVVEKGELPVVARLVVEIRSDGTQTIARGALEDAQQGVKVGIEAHGATPMDLATSLAKSMFSLPVLGAAGGRLGSLRSKVRALLPGWKPKG